MRIHLKLGILFFITSTSLFQIAHSCLRRRRSYRCRAVNGGWSNWFPDPVDHCSCSGTVRQDRRCTSPRPSCGGRSCSGRSTRYVNCNECSCNKGGCQHICEETAAGRTCSCYAGYKPSGTSCIEIRCATKEWRTPLNGIKRPLKCSDGRTVSVNTICTVECKPGYELQGTSTAVCTSQGNWNPGSSPRCTAKKCFPVYRPSRGQVTPSSCETGPSHGVTCYFSCLDNFQVDNTQASCVNGAWKTSPVFSCVDKKKPEFKSGCPSDQSFIADKGKTTKTVKWPAITAEDNDGEVPDMEVTPGYISPKATSHTFSKGIHVVTFRASDGSGNSRSCYFRVEVKVLRCNSLVAPPNGVLNPENAGNLLGTKCGVECLQGYKEEQPNPPRECERREDDIAYWTGEETNCTAVKCPAISVPLNVEMTGDGCQESSPQFGTTCFFNHQPGYKRINGSRSIRCNANQQWSGAPLQCEAVTCHPLRVDSKGLSVIPPSCEVTNSAYGTECSFQCASGYKLEGPSIKTCTQSGDWSFPANTYCKDIFPPELIRDSCPNTIVEYADRNSISKRVTWIEPQAIDNSGVTPKVQIVSKRPGDEFPEGIHPIKYIFTDDSGNTAECSFQVSVYVMRCIPKLIAPPSGRVWCTYGNRFGSNCSFTCRNGYRIRGSVHRQCEAEEGEPPAYWTGSETYCEIMKCDKLDTPANAIMSGCGKASNSYGDKCLFYCDHGYKAVSGTKERHCQENGTWSGSPLICKVVQCSSLAPPQYGNFSTSNCLNKPPYGTLCQYTCQKGYRVIGSQIRICSSSGKWSSNALVVCKDIEKPAFKSCPGNFEEYADIAVDYTTIQLPAINATDNSGQQPLITCSGIRDKYYIGVHLVKCIARDRAGNEGTCQFSIQVRFIYCWPPFPPRNGFIIGNCTNTLGSVCSFGCKEGYILQNGATKRTCLLRAPDQILGYWNGSEPSCKIQRCSVLSAPEHSWISPWFCSTKRPVQGSSCKVGCHVGFREVSGVDQFLCGSDGQWSNDTSKILQCEDVTPPSFANSCPSDILVSLDIDGTAEANWTIPKATDNSDIVPVVNVKPIGVRPPFKFNETSIVTYTAVDSNGNIALCTFRIRVEDDMGPQVLFCPASFTIKATAQKVIVKWKAPIFKDNSLGFIEPQCNRQSGDSFYWGDWNIFCRAHDNNPNNEPAVCHFVVTVKPKECIAKRPPKNGAMACDDWMFGRFCSPFCNDQYDFAQDLRNSVWACGASGVWLPFQHWPDCAATSAPISMRKTNKLHFFSGDCSDPEVKRQIKEQFIKLLNVSFFKEVCQADTLRDRCKADNVKVTCYIDTRRRRSLSGIKMQEFLLRIRRSVLEEAVVEFDVVVDLSSLRNDSSLTAANMKVISSEATAALKNAAFKLEKSVDAGNLSAVVEGQNLLPKLGSFVASEVQKTCSEGEAVKNNLCDADGVFPEFLRAF